MKFNKVRLFEELLAEQDDVTITVSKQEFIYILELIQKDIKKDNQS